MATFKSNYNINKKYVQCPYNPNHKVPANRMPIHLIKCEKQSDMGLMVCPFNASHRYSRNEFEHHLNHCKYRANVINPQTNTLFGSAPKPDIRVERLKPYESDDKPLKEEEPEKDVKAGNAGEEYWD